jgi:hypothetical protein
MAAMLSDLAAYRHRCQNKHTLWLSRPLRKQHGIAFGGPEFIRFENILHREVVV